jgi:hypothetical protein
VQVGESLLARKDLEHETHFKENMIGSVMPAFIAKQLMENETALPGSNRSKPSSGCADDALDTHILCAGTTRVTASSGARSQ